MSLLTPSIVSNSLQVLVASSSAYRRGWYLEQLPRYGVDVEVADDGLECIQKMRTLRPSVVLLEPVLLWGGSSGVLAVRSEEPDLLNIPVVVIAIEGVSVECFQLSHYLIQNLLVRRSSGQKLAAVLYAAARQPCVEHACHDN